MEENKHNVGVDNIIKFGIILGYRYMVSSNDGYLAGHVSLPNGHPWHGKNNGDISAKVHGGPLNCLEFMGEWIVRFECGGLGGAADKDTEYVFNECVELAKQARQAEL